MKNIRTEDKFICPDCGHDECELEEEYDDEGFPVAQDIVCNNCGYREVIY